MRGHVELDGGRGGIADSRRQMNLRKKTSITVILIHIYTMHLSMRSRGLTLFARHHSTM